MNEGGNTKNTGLSGGPVMDVRPPGAAPAPPTSKPVFTNNQPTQPDPMMTRTATPVTGTEPQAPEVANQLNQSPSQTLGQGQTMPSMPQQNTTNPDLGHNFVHPEPIIGHINKRSKLKKILIFLVALILLGGIAIAVWYFTGAKKTNQSTADTSVQTTQTVQKEETASATLYTAKLAGFSLDNKYNWKVTETDNQATATDSTAGDVVDIVDEFILNDKQKLIFNLNSGGRGGDCEPKAKDVAFAAGNDCASYKLLTAEKLPESSYPSAKRFSDRLNAYVVTYQLRLPLQNDTTFTLAGIESSTQNTDGSEVPLELNKPIMGAYSPLTILPLAKDKGSIYVKIVDNDGNPTQLSDADLQKVVEVLKTFKLI